MATRLFVRPFPFLGDLDDADAAQSGARRRRARIGRKERRSSSSSLS